MESGKLLNGKPFFVLWFRQPADHRKPDGEAFEQRIALWHKGFERPMVLHTTGYGGVDGAFTAEPTRLIDGNQLSVEERFFGKSTPASKDWTKLDIWQDSYVAFIQRAGTDAQCNEALRVVQRNALYRRSTLLPMLAKLGLKYGQSLPTPLRTEATTLLQTWMGV